MRKKLGLGLSVILLASTTAWGFFFLNETEADKACRKKHQKDYFLVKGSEAGHCVGMRRALDEDKPKNILDGEIEWIDGNTGKVTTVGPAPALDDFVVSDDGVLMIYEIGKQAEITWWDAAKGKMKVCNAKKGKEISVRDMRKGLVSFDFGPSFIRLKRKNKSQAYYENCRDNGGMLVFSELTDSDRSILEKYGSGGLSNDLTNADVVDTLPDILGRDKMVDEIIASLKTDSVRSTLLWGPPGVGKTSIVYRLATRIAKKENIPEWLEGWSVYSIDLGRLNGEGLAGKAESKMAEVVKAASGKKCILLMDEIHQLLGMGTGGEDKTDITELLKTNLANGQLAIVGTLTDQAGEMASFRQKKAIYERFSRVKVLDPPDDVLMTIYEHTAKKMQRKFNVAFSDKILGDIIYMTRRYIKNEHHPRVGIKVIQKVAASLNQQRKDWKDKTILPVEKAFVRHQIGLYGNIRSLIDGDGRTFKEIVRDFPKDVRKRYVGHENAVKAINGTLQMVATGNRPKGRPSGIFLFLGPSGVGKSYLAKLFGKMFGLPYKEYAMNQFKEEASVNNLLGAWKGYVGYSAGGGSLTKWIQDNPESVVNFDEVEKAHNSVKEILLRLMESGELEDNTGNEANFQNGYIVMTSNFGLKELIDPYDKHVLKIDDPDEIKKSGPAVSGNFPKSEEALKRRIVEMMRNRNAFGEYTDAFLGRIGMENIIIFHHLRPEEQAKIAGLEIKKQKEDLNPEYRDKVHVDKSVTDFIKQNGFSFLHGARRARDLARSFIVLPVATAMMNIKDEDAEVHEIRVLLRGAKRGSPQSLAFVQYSSRGGKKKWWPQDPGDLGKPPAKKPAQPKPKPEKKT